MGPACANSVIGDGAAELRFPVMAEQIGVMTSRAGLMTADELLRNDVPHKSTELVRGVLVVREPPGGWHGHLSARLTFVIGQYVYGRQSGMLFGQDTGFFIERDPDTVRAPDLAFVSAARVSEIARQGYVPFAPDLAVEILSPGDRPGEVLEKVAQWLTAGTRLVWVIDPDRGNARVHRADGSVDIVLGNGVLAGEDVLPGFTCLLADVLE
jgi:Uma2 family endonuclease